jgi:repressor LexA
VPVINRVAAGYPTWSGDMDYPPGVADDYVRCPDCHDPNAFAARVNGDSMQPKYHEGDIVIFSPAAPVADGDDCFIRLEITHETNFKRVFTEPEDRIRLQPRNEKYPPQIFHREQIGGLYKAVFRVEKLT